MTENKYLYQVIKERIGEINLERIEIPSCITDNIKYPLFDWQRSALQYFLAYEDENNKLVPNQNIPNHLLFNMATGTGKTLLMAALILYYYQKGYRHFIFFVNQNNIVGKTEENLLDKNHHKYLFRPNIVIDDKIIEIKKVDIFSENPANIEIIFTSIHKLHNSIYNVKENSVYLEDLQKHNIVMLGDEAHHLNADTKKKKSLQQEFELPTELSEKASETDVEKSWENTVITKILHKEKFSGTDQNKNVLLEFTATVPKDKTVEEKYFNKTIFRFDLKDFLKAGYTKVINLVSSKLNKEQRIIQALLFNWYRYKIALDNGLTNFKPVILFRSKLIEDSKRDFEKFEKLIKNLSVSDFMFLKEITAEETSEGKEIYERGKSRIMDIRHFIAEKNIDWNEIISYLQYSFNANHCIITNSKSGTKTIEKTTSEQEKLLNSLEDPNNRITAIFTVHRLTEGWDVLNLFDIVRLYEGQNEGGSTSKTSLATTSEVQLIGRGVRYFPFKYKDKPFLKRKFDNDLENDLRVLEEFYYHCDDEHRYLSELKNELKNKGYIDDTKILKTFKLKSSLNDDFVFTKFKIWVNERIPNPDAKKRSLEDVKDGFEYTYRLESLRLHEENLILDKSEDTEKYATKKEDSQKFFTRLKEFDKHIILKAINIKCTKDSSLFRYKNMNNELNIESIDEILEDKFLGNFPIEIVLPKIYKSIKDIPNKIQLQLLLFFFNEVENKLKEISNPYIGSEFRPATFNAIFGKPVERLVKENEESKLLEKDLKKKEWYVMDSFNGTSEEIVLINFITETMENLKDKYEKVYLLRNEEVYTIYDFQKGRGFQPDFLLLLKQKETDAYLQVLIEAKGDQFKDSTGAFTQGKEGWKEDFLKHISYQPINPKFQETENEKYAIVGLPMFNEKRKDDFKNEFNSRLEIN